MTSTNYHTGEGDELVPLPSTADLVQCDPSRCQDVVDYVSSISDELRAGEVTARQACYLPSIPGSSSPVIGGTGIVGMIVATGHSCWGIQNSCATGKLVSEFVFEGEAKSAQIGAMDPKIYM
jgi:glycine/D-amino acid oxidase-like deaminating enzyme